MGEKSNVPATTGSQLRRWDPFDLLTQMQSELDRFWGERRLPFRSLQRTGGVTDGWVPRVDIFEQNGSIVVKAEVPGIKKEDIDVEVENGDLVIRGERKTEEKVEEKDFFRAERSYGSFYRRIPLPEGATADKVKATYEDGVLQVTVPKPQSKQAESKKVAVR